MKINNLFSKFLLLGWAITGLVACTTDEPGENGLGSENNKNSVHVTADNLIGSLNVSDAKMIYRKAPADSRATWENEYYKLDASDNEVKLVLKGQFPVPDDTTGTLFEEHQINVALTNLVKLTERYLMFQPESESLGLAIDSINGELPYSIDYSSEYSGLTYLIEIPTEKAYRINAKLWYSEDGLNVQSDDNGNVFFYGQILDSDFSVFKLNPQRNELSTVLSSGQATSNYTIMGNGTLLYGNRALTTAGSIVDFGSTPFLLNNEICTYEVGKAEMTYDNRPHTFDIYTLPTENLIIYRWDRMDSGALNKVKVAETHNEDNENGQYYSEIGYYQQSNPKKNKLYFYFGGGCVSVNPIDIGNAYEFDGEKISVRYDFNEHMRNHLGMVSSEAEYDWQKQYGGGTTSFLKFDFNTEKFSYISFGEYDFYEVQTDSKSPNLTFSGIRLSDQKKITGYITPEDELVISSEEESGLHIIGLITLE